MDAILVLSTVAVSSGAGAPAPDHLPPHARARVLLILMSVAIAVLLGLLALTLLRRSWRRSALAPAGERRRRRDSHSLTPWEQAGRRASPIDHPDPPGASPGADAEPPRDSPR